MPKSAALPARPIDHDDKGFLIVGIGASAGGLEACTKLLEAMPASTGMAFILVQHLDPTHESMMVDLLSRHTRIAIRQAADAMPIEPDHLYIIPPAVYLSVRQDALHLSAPQARHGARLPFDFLLYSLAEHYGERAVGVILSGTGSDGSLGLKAIRENGGLVIAQDPGEARFDGMPSSALGTGAVDLVLSAAKIPDALVNYHRRMGTAQVGRGSLSEEDVQDWLPEIIALLRDKTVHDFSLYKQGTLQRRIERRMAMAAIEAGGPDRYIDILRADPAERDLLAKDLLINVTSFFRDPKTFDRLSEEIVPGLLSGHAHDQPIRVWIAGCSTGEEAYSLAMVFCEQIAAAKSSVKLQLFASDVDSDAVALAREGFYPATIEADISPARLARFFVKEELGYRVRSELRSTVVFTVQDLLADPPFSRVDMVSCRNLLIYLGAEAQAKVISLFHFALRETGILLLGSSETVGNDDHRFELVSKKDRLYRHVGRSRPGELQSLMSVPDNGRAASRQGDTLTPTRQANFAALCQRLVIESYAPAAILINSKYECLYYLGPTDRYLRVASGQPGQDLLAMAREGVRTKLRSAIQRAHQEKSRVVMPGGRTTDKGASTSFNIVIRPVLDKGEELLLVCFVENALRPRGRAQPVAPGDMTRIAELEVELDATRAELEGAIRNLELSSDEQKRINEESLSVNEEFQSTNEELLTSKEELQSLNEELTALNGQLQETLDRQRTTLNDLRNVLYSTNVATIFLDTKLNIRFFTPATKSLFNIIPGDVGRPLADLRSLEADGSFHGDAEAVLRNFVPIEREVETRNGAWYIRRIQPYRAENNEVEGVVITFADISERKRAADALGVAKRQAEQANIAKSRFLAAASHDLRQPLQTLVLLQGLLANTVAGEKAGKLVVRFDETLGAMSGMLNALLDINQIEVGAVAAELLTFPVNDLFERLRDEFTYHAQARGLALHVVPCAQPIRSDPRLLEQMIRNLLSNALKYTKQGKVLLGCRRHGDSLSIQVWDTGIGIPGEELHSIFDEYYQLDNPARERGLGLGLGLSIVQRLGNLLGHRVSVHSRVGKGSVFSIDIARSPAEIAPQREPRRHEGDKGGGEEGREVGTILVIEDDPEERDLFGLFLKDQGHDVMLAGDGIAALELVTQKAVRPGLILTDYDLPGGMNGIELLLKVREQLRRDIPAIILTGDTAIGSLRDVPAPGIVSLSKPVKLPELTQTIQRLLGTPRPGLAESVPPRSEIAVAHAGQVVFVVDDDLQVRKSLREVLEQDGRQVEDYASCEAFFEAYRPGCEACLLVDAYLPGMSGLELLARLNQLGLRVPSIMITGNSDVPMAVRAMKAGAADFIEKPVGRAELLASVARALEQARDVDKLSAWRADAAKHIGILTPRQREIMTLVLAGQPSKNIAADLGISQRTVESHRASIMRKTGTRSLPALARLALAAAQNGARGD